MSDLTPLNFDPSQIEEMEGFKVIPPGVYTVVIVESDVKDTKAGTGKCLELKYQIIEGGQTGNTLIDRLNISNPSDVAQKIGLSQLKNICEAVGHAGQLTNSEQLHGKPFSVQVEIEKFKSNTTSKELESNKIAKRMKRQEPSVTPVPTATADTAQKKASNW